VETLWGIGVYRMAESDLNKTEKGRESIGQKRVAARGAKCRVRRRVGRLCSVCTSPPTCSGDDYVWRDQHGAEQTPCAINLQVCHAGDPIGRLVGRPSRDANPREQPLRVENVEHVKDNVTLREINI